jgi:hypothetical protein
MWEFSCKIQPPTSSYLYHFVHLIYAILTHILLFNLVQKWQIFLLFTIPSKCWVSTCQTNKCSCKNPHPGLQVRVSMGKGAGCLENPRVACDIPYGHAPGWVWVHLNVLTTSGWNEMTEPIPLRIGGWKRSGSLVERSTRFCRKGVWE